MLLVGRIRVQLLLGDMIGKSVWFQLCLVEFLLEDFGKEGVRQVMQLKVVRQVRLARLVSSKTTKKI